MKFWNLKKRAQGLQTLAVVAAGALLPMVSARADFVVPPEIPAAGVNAGLVGTAVFAVIVGIKAFKWMRRAL